MNRIFIAINLTKETKEKLKRLKSKIEGLFPYQLAGKTANWVKVKNMHITLLFIGYAKDEEIPGICQTVKEIAKNQKPFLIKTEKICYGPPKKIPPRLIWIKAKEQLEAMEIAKELRLKISGSHSFKKIGKEEFIPHITLARIRAWQWRKIEPEERPDIEQEISFDIPVNSIEVMESNLKKGGVEYMVLQSAKLG